MKNERLAENLIHIKLKAIVTPYVSREPEAFYAKRLESIDKEYGFAAKDHLRILDLSGDSPRYRLIPMEWIEAIDGKVIEPPKTEWQVQGSSGNTYTVKQIGHRLVCSCPGFKYRKKCKHISQV